MIGFLQLVRSLIDKFVFNEPSAKPEIPATAGTHLVKSGIKLGADAQTHYCSGVGKLLYLVKCNTSRNNEQCAQTNSFYDGSILKWRKRHGKSHAACLVISQVWC